VDSVIAVTKVLQASLLYIAIPVPEAAEGRLECGQSPPTFARNFRSWWPGNPSYQVLLSSLVFVVQIFSYAGFAQR